MNLTVPFLLYMCSSSISAHNFKPWLSTSMPPKPDFSGFLRKLQDELDSNSDDSSCSTTDYDSHSEERLDKDFATNFNNTPSRIPRKAFTRQLPDSAEKPLHTMSVREKKRRIDGYVPPKECCNRKCFMHFPEEQIRALRKRVWTDSEDKVVRRRTMANLHRDVLLVTDKPCCIRFLTRAFSVSNDFIYGKPKDSRKVRLALVREHIINFFKEMRETGDHQPDTGRVLLWAPTKVAVYGWYMESALEFKCTKSYFNRVWQEEAKDVQLRKHLRFTKCTECEKLREVKSIHKHTRRRS